MLRINNALILLAICIPLLSFTQEDEEMNSSPSSDVASTKKHIMVSPHFYETPLYINHRGLNEYPENTFSAIKAAVQSGFKAIECDICMTADGVFVLQHDPTINRCSNGTGGVNNMTYQELLSYDFGSWKGEAFAGEPITRLDFLLDYCKKEGIIIELDLADETRFKREWLPALYKLVKKKKMLGQTMFTATYDELKDFLSKPRDMIISVSGVTNMNKAKQALLLKDKVSACNFSLYKGNLTRTIADFAHDNGILIKCWTTTTKAENDRLISLGADQIITEYTP